MNNDDFFSYLVATDQVDEFLGLKEVITCPTCGSELYIYDDDILYCYNCDKLIKYNLNKKIYNKELTLEQKRIIMNRN